MERLLRPRRHNKAILLLAVLPAIHLACAGGAARHGGNLRGSRPNIIFIFSDDHAAHAISAYRAAANPAGANPAGANPAGTNRTPIHQTPNIDRLASRGMLFTNCFCGNSICGPSRATILTGKHTHANGFMRNGNRFDPAQTTFPKLLRAAGYETAMIGKWHLGSKPTGFDHWMILPGQGAYYNPDFETKEGRVRKTGYCTDITTDLALDWLESERDPGKPFVLMCQHKAPHRTWMPGPQELGLYRDETIPEPPTLFDDYAGRGRAARRQEMEIDRHMYMFYDLMLVPDGEEKKSLRGPDRFWSRGRDRMNTAQREAWDRTFAEENRAFREAGLEGQALVRWKYQRYIKNYLRCVAGVDKSVGRILDYLDRNPELKENTIVIYSSDQGFFLGDHGWYDKRWIYEESLRMPFIVSWPGKVAAGTKTDALAQNIDFCPTFLEVAGAPIPRDVHGESLLPVLAANDGATPGHWRDAVYYHYYESQVEHQVAAHYGVRTEKYKLVHFYEPENRSYELYDLAADPQELNTVHEDPAYSTIFRRMKQRLAELRTKYGDDTGTVGDFDLTSGVASAEPTDDGGFCVRSNFGRTYGLYLPAEPLESFVLVRGGARPGRSGAGRGMIAVTGSRPREQLFRAGIDFATNRLVVLDPDMREIAGTDVSVPQDEMVPITVQIDLARHGLVVAACDHTLQVRIPNEWQGITAYGYALTDTMEFAKIRAVGR